MPIEYRTGDLFQSCANILINTVNCVGVMGAGLAAQFKKRYPMMYKEYKKSCDAGEVKIGKLHVWHKPLLNEWIINFPTKQHWRNKSNLCDIEAGLIALKNYLDTYKDISIAVPPLGCGKGGLSFSDVMPLIEKHLGHCTSSIYVYPPSHIETNISEPITILVCSNKPSKSELFVTKHIAAYIIANKKPIALKITTHFEKEIACHAINNNSTVFEYTISNNHHAKFFSRFSKDKMSFEHSNIVLIYTTMKPDNDIYNFAKQHPTFFINYSEMEPEEKKRLINSGAIPIGPSSDNLTPNLREIERAITGEFHKEDTTLPDIR